MKKKSDWLDDIQEQQQLKYRFAGKVEEREIETFEKEYGLTLPADYRAFIQRLGCGSIGHFEIFGLGVKPVGIPSLPWLLNDLKALDVMPPAEILPVSPLGDGTYAAVLHKPKGAFCKGTVVRWTPNSKSARLEVLGSSFSSYLLSLITGR